MHADRFDAMTLSLSTADSRRGFLRLVAGGLGVSMTSLAIAAVDAKRKKKKKKKKRRNNPSCSAESRPTCDSALCLQPFCDIERREWYCQNKCEGTSKPKCLNGQCIEACDVPGMTECGDQCCNPLVHSECCQGTCCRHNEVCIGGTCATTCPAGETVCRAADGVDWACCDQTEHCSNGYCCPAGDGPRCGESTLCCNEPTDFCHGNECCKQGVDICGETCCPSWAPRCCSPGTPATVRCCTDNSKCATCPSGKKVCCDSGSCKAGNFGTEGCSYT